MYIKFDFTYPPTPNEECVSTACSCLGRDDRHRWYLLGLPQRFRQSWTRHRVAVSHSPSQTAMSHQTLNWAEKGKRKYVLSKVLGAFSLKIMQLIVKCHPHKPTLNFIIHLEKWFQSASIYIYSSTPEGVLISDRVHYSKYSLSFKLYPYIIIAWR